MNGHVPNLLPISPTHREVSRLLASGDIAGAREAIERELLTQRAANDPFASIIYDEQYPAEETPIDWLVPSLMLGPGRVAVVVGGGGVGKTFVVQSAAVALENGCDALGGLILAGSPKRTAHIDTDQGIRATRRRYRRIAAGLGVPRRPALLALRDVMRTDPTFRPTDVDKLRLLLSRFDLVVIDALAGWLSAFDLDENSAADTRSALDALQYASDAENCTVIVIAHTGKDIRDENGRKVQQKEPRGSSGIRQAAGVIWAFTGDVERGAIRSATRERDAADDDDDGTTVRAFHYRIERAGTDTPGMRRRDGTPIPGLVVARCGPPERRGKGEAADGVRADILRAVGAGSLRSQRDVETYVTGNRQTIRAVFKDLCQEGAIAKNLDGDLIVTEAAKGGQNDAP